MKKFLTVFFLFLMLAIPVFAENNSLPAETGIVTSVEYFDMENITGGENLQTKQRVNIKILSGKFKGNNITTDNIITSNPAYDIMLSKGDKVILHLEPKMEFVEDLDDVNIFVSDIERTNIIFLFAGLFVILLLIIGKHKGLFSFISILITTGLIFSVLGPMILHGISPVIAALVVCILSSLITIYLVGGFNYKSTSAILGTVTSLIFSGGLSLLAIKLARLTGFSGEETMFLYSSRPDLDFTGILAAAMMIAALGAVMDVGVSIASTINEIYNTDITLKFKELFNSGMNVGKDIIGTMSNTLILVYLGSALPLLLLANNIDWVKFFNLNQVTTEILSALIGSIAILLCVPLTAVISAYLVPKKSK